jgi:hypothetical protein
MFSDHNIMVWYVIPHGVADGKLVPHDTNAGIDPSKSMVSDCIRMELHGIICYLIKLAVFLSCSIL